GDDGVVSDRQDPPGAAQVRGGDRGLERIPGQVPEWASECRRPARDSRYPTPDRGRPPRQPPVPRGPRGLERVRRIEPARRPGAFNPLPGRRKLPDGETV